MANKNIEDFFGDKKRDKSKCINILDLDFVEATASALYIYKDTLPLIEFV